MLKYLMQVFVLSMASPAFDGCAAVSCSAIVGEGSSNACIGDGIPIPQDDEDVSSLIQLQGQSAPFARPSAPQLAEIPKIVHHVYKVNLEFEEWPSKIWEASYHSWKKHFPEPEYKHFFWGDSEMSTFFQTKCPSHWKAYSAEKRAIVRSDLSRYCLMSKIGGIYADLDYEVRKNFYKYLKPGMVNLVESPYQSESVQNSLMASPPGLPYWEKLMGIVDSRSYYEENILKVAGPALLDELPETKDAKVVHILPCASFQPATHIRNGEAEAAMRKSCPILDYGLPLGDDVLLGIHWGTSSYNVQEDKDDIEVNFDEFSRKP